MLAFQMDVQDLQSCLAQLPALQLKGFELLALEQAGQASSLPRETLREAVLELMVYTDACARCLQRLRALGAVPLAEPLVEWVL